MATWHPGLAVGHPIVDGQHQELFAQADRLIDALRRAQATAEVLQQLQFLRDYCVHHFETEEGLMEKVAYPLLATHRNGHRHFSRQFRAIEQKALAKGPSSLVALELSALIRGWLVDHIGGEDAKVARFVRGPGAAVRPAP